MEGIDQGSANQKRKRGGREGVGCRGKDRKVTVVAWNREHGRSTTEKKADARMDDEELAIQIASKIWEVGIDG